MKSRAPDPKLAALELHQLTGPLTVWDKLEWIVVRGLPDYLYLPTTQDEHYIIHGPRNLAVERAEVQNVFQEAFLRSTTASKKKVLKSYVAGFPHLAFDRESWMWERWQEWRSRHTAADQEMLAMLASGIKSRGWGWMSKTRSVAWRLRQARLRVSQLKAMGDLKGMYRTFVEGIESPDPEVVREANRRTLPPLLKRIKSETGYPTSKEELTRLKLSGVIRRAVSKAFLVRERDLH